MPEAPPLGTLPWQGFPRGVGAAVRLVIAGGRSLRGAVRVGPAKNALLPQLAATLLAEEPVTLTPAAEMLDVGAMCTLLELLGARVRRRVGVGTPGIEVSAAGPLGSEAPAEAFASMRASLLVMGPLLARCGRIRLARPGGGAIGTRPIDLHLLAMTALGARVVEGADWVEGFAPGGLTGGVIRLPYPSHTATENALLAAALARGTTTIIGAAREPEVVDTAALLQAMGARIRGPAGPWWRSRAYVGCVGRPTGRWATGSRPGRSCWARRSAPSTALPT